MSQTLFPSLPLASWQATRDTLKKYALVVSRVRRAHTPKQKHWYHVSLRSTATGLITPPIATDNFTYEMLMDFTAHDLIIKTSQGELAEVPFIGQSQSEFQEELLENLADLDIHPKYDQSLHQDNKPGTYNETAVSNFWAACSQIDIVFRQFKGSLREESGPVQLWPHHFDLSLLWFSGHLVSGQDPENEEYADEQMNFGFVTGDESIANPYFYITAYPTPEGFIGAQLPKDAYWFTDSFKGAVLNYDALLNVDDPKAKLLDFLQSVHKLGKGLM